VVDNERCAFSRNRLPGDIRMAERRLDPGNNLAERPGGDHAETLPIDLTRGHVFTTFGCCRGGAARIQVGSSKAK